MVLHELAVLGVSFPFLLVLWDHVLDLGEGFVDELYQVGPYGQRDTNNDPINRLHWQILLIIYNQA